MNFSTQFKNKWYLNGSFSRQNKNLSTTLLRGGPSFKLPGNWDLNLNVNSDQTKKISLNCGSYYGFKDKESNSHYHEYWAGINIKPTNASSISIDPDFGSGITQLQYLNTEYYNGSPRYLFGELDQKTFNLTIRLNYTITPELSVQYYGQPYISSGKYSQFKMVTDPRANKYSDRFHIFNENQISYNPDDNNYNIDENLDGTNDYLISNPDYNFRQYRSNLVVRWEYLPGSIIYFVWSQGYTSTDTNGNYSFGNDMKELFGVQPHNVFLIKLSYWFSL
jgi:hypothetical protein